MNCGIEVLKRLDELSKIDLSNTIIECEQKVDKKGLSMFDMKEALSKVIFCQGVASLSLIKKTPYIAFIGLHSLGHYVLVEKIDQNVYLFDPANHFNKCSLWFFYLIWSKKAIIFPEIELKELS
ncbi:MAG: cysteine peptidase family C39 domain-containing protein [Traorella sp.]